MITLTAAKWEAMCVLLVNQMSPRLTSALTGTTEECIPDKKTPKSWVFLLLSLNLVLV
jgi:hypothetical protein